MFVRLIAAYLFAGNKIKISAAVIAMSFVECKFPINLYLLRFVIPNFFSKWAKGVSVFRRQKDTASTNTLLKQGFKSVVSLEFNLYFTMN